MNKTLKTVGVVIGSAAAIKAGAKDVNAVDVSAAYGISTNNLTSEHGTKLEFDGMKMHGVDLRIGIPVDAGFLRGIEAGFSYNMSLGKGKLTENHLTKDMGDDLKLTIRNDISAKAMRYDLALVGPRTGVFDHVLVLSGDRFDITKSDIYDAHVEIIGVTNFDLSGSNNPKGTYKVNGFDAGYALRTGHSIGGVNLSGQMLIALGRSSAKGDWKEQLGGIKSFDEKSTYLRLGFGAEAEMDLGTVSPFFGASLGFWQSLSGSYKQTDDSSSTAKTSFDKAQKYNRLNAGIYAGGRVKF